MISATLLCSIQNKSLGQEIEILLDRNFDNYVYDIKSFKSTVDSIYKLNNVINNPELQDRHNILKNFFFYPEDNIDSIKYFLSRVPENLSRRNSGFHYATLGRIDEYHSNFEEAIKKYIHAIELLDPEIDKTFITFLQLSIGIIHFRNFTFEQSIDYLNIAFELGKEYNLKYHVVESLDYMASAYMYIGELKVADSIWLMFHEFASRIDNPELSFYRMTNIGHRYDAMEMHDTAAYYFDRAFEYSKVLDDSLIEREALMYLGEQYTFAHDFEKAMDIFNILKTYPPNEGDLQVEQRIRYFGAVTKAGLREYSDAYNLLYEHDSISSEYWQLSTKEKMLEFETKYETAKKDAEISAQQLQLSKTNTQRNLLVIGAGGLVFLVWFLIYRNRKNKILADTKIANLESQQKLIALDYMVQGQEEERKRIAQDLHDGLGGLLTSVKHQIRSIQDQITTLSQVDIASDAERLITKACDEVRRISHDMMPASLVSLGLVDALEDMALDISTISDINFVFKSDGNLAEISDKLKVNIYRIVQEVINNILKHADAKSISLTIKETSGNIFIKITDDGNGFDMASVKRKNGLGLNSIHSRVNYLEGKMQVTSEPDNGTVFKLNIPIQKE